MALNIKDDETDRLARQLAQVTGESLTTTLRVAVQQRLERERAKAHVHASTDVLTDIIRRGRARAMLDERPASEILGYDESGLPT